GVSGGLASYWPGGGTSGCPELELGAKQLIHTVLIHDQHHQVHALSANLCSPASSSHREERRCAPAAIRQSARRDPAAMLSTEDEAAFDHGRDNGDTLRFGKYLIRNAVIGRRQKLINVFSGIIQAC